MGMSTKNKDMQYLHENLLNKIHNKEYCLAKCGEIRARNINTVRKEMQ